MASSPAPSSFPRLETERLLLRRFEERDAPDIARSCNDYDIASNLLSTPYPYTLDNARDWIPQSHAHWDEKSSLNFAVARRADDALVGSIGFKLAPEHHRAEIGYWFARDHWGRGYATEAARRLIDFGFESLGLHRIFAYHYHWNPASGRVLEKCGLKHEGIMRQHITRLGRVADSIMFAILRDEWESPRRP
ncbi:MAG TPA: GNAT family protein [Phycisphaerales bacterium]|nr:GNAT family protein [Phycisphaerales bacterium]